MMGKCIGLLAILVIIISITPAFALTELERTSMVDPRLVNVFGAPVSDKINVNQQTKSQNFVYLVQIKNDANIVISLGWISGQLTPDQKLSPSLSWSATESGEFIAEVFVWEGIVNHRALSEYRTLQIRVS
jgi:hypothetical protein